MNIQRDNRFLIYKRQSNMQHPKKERTFVIIKPDGIQRSMVGEIISRFERVGLKLTAMKMLVPKAEQCWTHYNKDEAWFQSKGERIVKGREEMKLPVEKEAIEYGRDIIGQLVTFMTSGPVLAMVIEGNSAVGIVTKLVGGTEPLTSDIGTIRGDLTLDSYDLAGMDGRAVRNLIHCSDKPEEAEREIKIWFDESEIIAYRSISEAMLYDVNLDGILE
ncbi:MAG: Nucleoside diphosphate kinase [Candidatus Moranbacteria bacterium GW2011_GWC2_37_73]|nr:MAG: nucleoside diphosphate kinase, nucleoside-diphosphate kinase [Parcubacteria group bacterium GW2011_GWC1_36_108]KKQ00197.1 MAG: Nucleoside diphosphate kinase [Candidatus Moranbacteria bacterium GW2011_GWD2_36_198]KKQ39570.1 MAG: Nucleoside diphosphate kinase [Candidatus Moranbacteria bacterium GW2011_GWC2_37_73]